MVYNGILQWRTQLGLDLFDTTDLCNASQGYRDTTLPSESSVTGLAPAGLPPVFLHDLPFLQQRTSLPHCRNLFYTVFNLRFCTRLEVYIEQTYYAVKNKKCPTQNRCDRTTKNVDFLHTVTCSPAPRVIQQSKTTWLGTDVDPRSWCLYYDC